MTLAWRVTAEWEFLDKGSEEERACFAALGIQANGVWLTEGRDALANRLRQSPLLSAYHLAEWFAWNWWRLRWEPRASNEEWRFAHKISNVGGGYIWPNIAIFSDGERTALIARSTRDRAETPFRYINDAAVVIPSVDFEGGVDEFLEQVLDRLESTGLSGTNLQRIWSDVLEERRDPEIGRVRKIEALLGSDPDESSLEVINRLISDADTLGMTAVEELAADHGQAGEPSLPTAADLGMIARKSGFGSRPLDMVAVPEVSLGVDRRGQCPAWLVGARFAQALREQEKLSDETISNERLAEMLAVDSRVLEQYGDMSGVGMSFALDEGERGHVVLRSKWQEGRRFDLARLLGDRLMSKQGLLYPATRASTYRQKAQRSFAAELLCPYKTVFHMLQGDFSWEKQREIAEYFEVSELTIRTQLVNHKILEREDLDPESLSEAA